MKIIQFELPESYEEARECLPRLREEAERLDKEWQLLMDEQLNHEEAHPGTTNRDPITMDVAAKVVTASFHKTSVNALVRYCERLVKVHEDETFDGF